MSLNTKNFLCQAQKCRLCPDHNQRSQKDGKQWCESDLWFQNDTLSVWLVHRKEHNFITQDFIKKQKLANNKIFEWLMTWHIVTYQQRKWEGHLSIRANMQRPPSYQQKGKRLLQLVSPSSISPMNPHCIVNGKLYIGRYRDQEASSRFQGKRGEHRHFLDTVAFWNLMIECLFSHCLHFCLVLQHE